MFQKSILIIQIIFTILYVNENGVMGNESHLSSLTSTTNTSTTRSTTISSGTTKLVNLLVRAASATCVNQNDYLCFSFIQNTPQACVTNTYYINSLPFNVYCASLCNYNCYVAPTPAPATTPTPVGNFFFF
jgi:hypothetical protein